MAPESTSNDQGVPTFEYNPRDYSMLPDLVLDRPLDRLQDRLLGDLAGRTLTTEQIYENHSVGERFTKKNYKTVLQTLHARGSIETDRKPKKGTFADDISVTFPPR